MTGSMDRGQEMAIKLGRVRALLTRLSLDAVYLRRQDNFAFMTCGGFNFVGIAEMGNCGLLITHDGQHAITDCIEAPRMAAEEGLEALGYTLHAGLWHDRAFEQKTIERLVPSGRVWFDHNHPMGGNILEQFKPLRFSLTAAEITRYRRAGELAAGVLEEALLDIRPGDTELKTAGRVAALAQERGLAVVHTLCAADGRIARFRHPIPTQTPVTRRVQLGSNLRWNGLTVCLTRYRSFEPVDPAWAAQYKANAQIACEMNAHSVAGNTYVSVLEKARETYAALGYASEFDKHHQGGPIGYAGRDYRVDFETPGVIMQNQAFCWNPSITGTKSEDTVISTPTGPLCVTPTRLPVIAVSAAGRSFRCPAIFSG